MLCIYRLHEFSKSVFIEEFSNILSVNKAKNLIAIGDINIDVLNDLDKNTENYLFAMASNGLKSFINEPTRVTDSSKSCIDHIFFRARKNIKNFFSGKVYDLKLTDHSMIALNYCSDCNRSESKKPLPKTLKYRVDFVLLKESLTYEFWEPVYSEINPSTAFDLFINILQDHIKSCTFLLKQNSGKKKRLKPWMTTNLLNQIRKKKKLSMKCKKHPHNIKLKKHYDTMSKTNTTLICWQELMGMYAKNGEWLIAF